jgi:hypothetical protein
MQRTFFLKAATAAALSVAAVAATGTSAEAQRLNFIGSVNIQNAQDPANLLLDFLAGANQDVAGTPTGTVEARPTVQPPFSPSVMPGTTGTIADLTVSASGVLGTPVNPFVTLGAYTFSLDNSVQAPAGGFNFGPVQLVDNGNGGSSAFLSVRGTVTGGAYGAAGVGYNGVFTAQFADLTAAQVFNRINEGGQLTARSFSAEFAVVPEPSTYALLATGISALGLVARRRRQA